MSEERMLTPREIAERCQVSTKTVLRAIRYGRLRASRLGDSGAYRVWERDMHAWIEASVVSPHDRRWSRHRCCSPSSRRRPRAGGWS